MMSSDRAVLALSGLSRKRPNRAKQRKAQALPSQTWETKSARGEAALPMVEKMLAELRHQFTAFRRLRLDARRKLLVAGEDEALQRLAKADLRLVADGLNLVVRTLEKLDTIRRGLVADHEREEDQRLAALGLADGRAMLVTLVNARIEEEVARRLALATNATGGEGSDAG